MSAPAFNRRVVLPVVIVAGLAFFAALIGPFLTEGRDPSSFRPDVYSTSALGHHALRAFLVELGYEVRVDRRPPNASSRHRSLLVLAEPHASTPAEMERLVRQVESAHHVLVVLPKWRGQGRRLGNRSWVESVSIDPTSALALLDALELEAELEIGGEGDADWVPWDESPEPSLGDPVQALLGDDLEPFLETRHGLIVGERSSAWNHKLWVVSDPDLLNNHGLARGENAEIVASLFKVMAGDQGFDVVFDETTHGHEVGRGVWSQLLSFPLVILLFQGLLLLGFLAWSAAGAFGARIEDPLKTSIGRRALVDNTAELLRFGGHTEYTLTRYCRDQIDLVAQAYHVSRDSEDDAWRARLVHITTSRAPDHDFGALMARIDAASSGGTKLGSTQAVDLARDVRDWRSALCEP
ncbi:MAG: DUF4350 domain-containing protein [Salinibacterium sp.]|nr:DUF4350 domain-containing protein [Planctomycetota bacterium]MCB1282658.1 DUF4350 domain-containing protein [Salinibacterium sp.]